jgi:hypothetical protein
VALSCCRSITFSGEACGSCHIGIYSATVPSCAPNKSGCGVFATPHYLILMKVYTLARYLMRNTDDAEDAVQECYLRALRHFDTYRGPAMKPWLLAILRNVCNTEFARRSRGDVPTDYVLGGPRYCISPVAVVGCSIIA